MRLISNGRRGQIHRVDDNKPVCHTRVYFPVNLGIGSCVNPRRLCGNCFRTKDIQVWARADSRIVSSRCE